MRVQQLVLPCTLCCVAGLAPPPRRTAATRCSAETRCSTHLRAAALPTEACVALLYVAPLPPVGTVIGRRWRKLRGLPAETGPLMAPPRGSRRASPPAWPFVFSRARWPTCTAFAPRGTSTTYFCFRRPIAAAAMFDVGSPSTPRGLAWQLAALFTPKCAAARQPFQHLGSRGARRSCPVTRGIRVARRSRPFTGLG